MGLRISLLRNPGDTTTPGDGGGETPGGDTPGNPGDTPGNPGSPTEDPGEGPGEKPGDDPGPTYQEPLYRSRSISGNVWEDIRTETGSDHTYKFGNGELDSDENGAKGITVKLYEVKSFGEVERAEVKTNKYGNYTFSQFIPGDYRVKFTYGGKTYNGISYKSSIISNQHYQNEISGNPTWYYNSLYNIVGSNEDGNIVNKAMDNAKRRIKLISDYTEMDKEKYPILSELEFANCYMEAYTPNIFIAVDVNPNEFNDTDGVTRVKWNLISDLSISGVSLGIEKRPETKLTIEEHVKRVTLKANDGKVLLNSKVDNDDRLFDTTIDLTPYLTGISDGLRALKNIRSETGTNMGAWEIQTDVSEVIQGAEIEAEVVYQVKNESDVDYLSNTLILEYREDTIQEYKQALNEILTYSNKDVIDLIGQTYYTGIINGSVGKVLTSVGNIQDYVNDLTFKKGDGLQTEDDKTYKRAIDDRNGKEEINLDDYTKVLDLYNGNLLLKDKTTGKIITAVKIDDSYYKVNTEETTIQTVIRTQNPIGKLRLGEYKRFYATFGTDGLTPNGKLDFDNYIAEILSYSTANGRPDEKAIPGNLDDKFVYSQDSDVTLSANERDEFAGEKIIIIPPTGENKTGKIIMISSIVAGIGIIAVGIVLIKKYVIK